MHMICFLFSYHPAIGFVWFLELPGWQVEPLAGLDLCTRSASRQSRDIKAFTVESHFIEAALNNCSKWPSCSLASHVAVERFPPWIRACVFWKYRCTSRVLYGIVMYCVYSVRASSKRHRAVNCSGWPSWFASSRSCGDLRPSKSPFYELSLRSHLTDRFERSGQVWSYALCFVNPGNTAIGSPIQVVSNLWTAGEGSFRAKSRYNWLIHVETQTMDAVSWPEANRVYRCCDGWDAERAEQVLYNGF